jgi:hypothetical protein
VIEIALILTPQSCVHQPKQLDFVQEYPFQSIWRLKMKLGLFALVSLVGGFLHSTSMQASVNSVSDVQSMVLRSDGKYDVVCKNGKTEIVTPEQIRDDKVCGSTTPEPGPQVEAIFTRPQGDFFVLCKNKSWDVATAKMIQEGKVCLAQQDTLVGTWTSEWSENCTGQWLPGKREITFKSDLTCTDVDAVCTWTQTNKAISVTWTKTNVTVKGEIKSSKLAEGVYLEGPIKWCWRATK